MPRDRSHIDLTVWPITVLFVVELARIWPAIGGASAFAAASPASWLALLVWTALVTLALGAYARGWSILARDGGPGPYTSVGSARLQKLAGGAAWALVVAHLVLYWVMTVRAGPVALSHYELMRGFLSRPAVLAFYVAGLGALGLFLSQGFAASVRVRRLRKSHENSRWIELGCTLVAAVMMLMAVNILSHFVTGRAYWMSSPPVSSETQEGPGGDSP